MRRVAAIWLAMSAIGLGIIVFVPESGPPVISLSRHHGPAWSDIAGLALVIGGWIAFLQALGRRLRRMAKRPAWLLVGIASASAMGCVVAAMNDLDILIGVLACTSLAAQLRLASMVGCKEDMTQE